jgi:adenine phosphoribosyltransferase
MDEGDPTHATEMLPAEGEPAREPGPAPGERPAKSLTIGAVCKALQQEFPDISISKIRYLEDQKLLSPRRTPGGYRLYSSSDVSRLRTILRLQRDEFLPLRVIRQELAAGRTEADIAQPTPAGPSGDARPGAALRRLTFSIRDRGALYSLDEVVEETGADPRLIAELEDFGIVRGVSRGGTRYYDETEREIVRATTELVAEVAQSRAPQGGGRGAREPGRGGLAPQAPPAGARPAAHRDVNAGPAVDLRDLIRDIPDFPRAGIVFKDITPLLLRPAAVETAVRGLAGWARPREVDYVVAAEARGFILGAALALELGAGFVPARKPGKLPHDTVSAEYILEYGIDALEVHADALAHGARVLVHDDLLATGGTARAVAELVERLGGNVVGCGFLVELAFLGGRDRLAGFDVHALVTYDSE